MSGTQNCLTTRTFPWRNQVNEFVIKIQATGIVQKIFSDNMRRADEEMMEPVARQTKIRVLELTHLQTTFFILCGGLLISALVLIIEYLCFTSVTKLWKHQEDKN